MADAELKGVWLMDSCCDNTQVTQFATYPYAAESANSFPQGNAEVHRHPSGIGWAVWIRIAA